MHWHNISRMTVNKIELLRTMCWLLLTFPSISILITNVTDTALLSFLLLLLLDVIIIAAAVLVELHVVSVVVFDSVPIASNYNIAFITRSLTIAILPARLTGVMAMPKGTYANYVSLVTCNTSKITKKSHKSQNSVLSVKYQHHKEVAIQSVSVKPVCSLR